MKVIVSCSKCWEDVKLRQIDRVLKNHYEGECSHCMVTLDATIDIYE